MGCSSSRTAPARVLPTGALLQEQAAPSWVPHGATSPANKPAPAWALHGVTAYFRHPPAPAWGPFHGLQVDIYSIMDLHGLQGDNLPHHGLQHDLQGKSLCSGISSTCSLSPLLLHWPWCLRSCHSHIISLLSLQCCFTAVFSPLLTITIADGLGLGQWRVCRGVGWHWLYQTWGKLLAASHRSHRYTLPPTATKTLPCKPITRLSSFSWWSFVISGQRMLNVDFHGHFCRKLLKAWLVNLAVSFWYLKKKNLQQYHYFFTLVPQYNSFGYHCHVWQFAGEHPGISWAQNCLE